MKQSDESNQLLKSPCGKFKNSRRKLFTKQTLRDHIQNCPQCNQNKIVFDPHDFYGNEGNLIDDFDTSDMPDGAYLALEAELGGDLDD